MRTSAAALALIPKPGQTARWLVQWNESWQAYALVGGHVESGESYAGCVAREITEELGLAAGTQFRVGLYPLVRLDFRAFSASAQAETEYHHELFPVELLNDAADRIAADPANHWVTRGQIASGRADDGRPINEQVRRLFDALDKSQTIKMDAENMIPYIPKPIDTSHVQLPPEVDDLTELLAENNHEIWAAQRVKDGWTFGPVRDDPNKKHPCLISYADLPESEKVYDRHTAMETLKLIVKLGYRIVRP